MTKLHVAWIVVIVFASLIIFAALSYLFYRLYINRIYKRQRSWKDIRSPAKDVTNEHSERTVPFLQPRVSLMPLIREYLPHTMMRSFRSRRMTTDLQFDEPPHVIENFQAEWEAMDIQSRTVSCSLHLHFVESFQALPLYKRSWRKVLITVWIVQSRVRTLDPIQIIFLSDHWTNYRPMNFHSCLLPLDSTPSIRACIVLSLRSILPLKAPSVREDFYFDRRSVLYTRISIWTIRISSLSLSIAICPFSLPKRIGFFLDRWTTVKHYCC